jgi:integrase
VFPHQHPRARRKVVRYRHRKRRHLKWTIAGHYLNGKRVRKFFTTEKLAETYLEQIETKAKNLGTRALMIDPALHVMAVECSDYLAPYGKTIAEATAFYCRHLEQVAQSCTVRELSEMFLQHKRDDGRRNAYLRNLRAKLRIFSQTFGQRVIATLTVSECDDWLRSQPVSGSSRNSYRRVLTTFFNYAMARNVCADNPMLKTEKARVIDKPVEVFTPQQMQRLLDSADAEIVAALAIGAFAGLRRAEISRLDWSEVQLERGFIEVTASKSKTARRRLVTIQPTLKTWLEITTYRKGAVLPEDYEKKLKATRERAEIASWPANGLRHSFASYHLAKFQDAPALALQLGHTTTAMLFSHYREVVTPEAAEAYWQITPKKPKEQENELTQALVVWGSLEGESLPLASTATRQAFSATPSSGGTPQRPG